MQGLLFNDGWEYYPCGSDLSPLKPEEKISLPHDAMIGCQRDGGIVGGNRKGYFPDGSFIYKKTFQAPEDWKDKKIYLLFEGVYRKARIYINEEYAGQGINGYSEIFIDITGYIRYHRSNEIKVIVTTGNDSRWYTGAGIYRDVKLFVTNYTHFKNDGIRFTTKSVINQVASIQGEIRIENDTPVNKHLEVDVQILDEKGTAVNRDRYELNCKGQCSETLYPRLYISGVKTWDCESPYLYTCIAKLKEGDAVVDEISFTFGVRELSLDNVNGLCINGKSVKLYGGCIHHDNGVIGAASFRKADERRICRLKEAGYNAIRSAHNPISRSMLDACDKYGILVMDELSDVWNTPKCIDDDSMTFCMEWEQLIEKMVQKDYNHPSVIMYSIGNEIPELGNRTGAKVARMLGNKVRKLDSTRYITCAINGLMSNISRISEIFGDMSETPDNIEELQDSKEVNSIMSAMGNFMKQRQNHPEIVKSTAEAAEALDIVGYNYAESRYLSDSELFSNWVAVGSETFPKDLAENWRLTLGNGNVLGDFSWTAWDYIGEVGIGMNHFDSSLNAEGHGAKYPYLAAYCGDFDLIGNRRPQSYYREIVVGGRKDPYISVQDPETYGKQPYVSPWSWFPTESTWTFYGSEGKKTLVEVYCNADEVELLVNDRSVGRKKVPQKTIGDVLAFYVSFETEYEPGILKAIAYKSGEKIGDYQIQTAEKETVLSAEPEKQKYDLKCGDILFIPIRFIDKNGMINTQSNEKININVTGAGILYGFGTGNPVVEQSYKSNICRAYQGQALLIVRAVEKGSIYIDISSEGKETQHIVLESKN